MVKEIPRSTKGIVLGTSLSWGWHGTSLGSTIREIPLRLPRSGINRLGKGP